MSSAQPVCLITGASAGIGAALARQFASAGYDLVLVARREPELSALAESISQAGYSRPSVVCADLGTEEGLSRLAEELRANNMEPAILVNNAGFGVLGAATDLGPKTQLAMIDLNVRAMTDLTLRFLDSVRRHKGGILNVASIAGFLPGPGLAVYHATKAYVVSLTDALHEELKAEGVKVCALCPGPVPTGFFDRAGIPTGYFPRFLTRSVERVAQDGYRGFMSGHRTIVPGAPNRLVTLLPRLLPRALVLTLAGRRWKKTSSRLR